MTGPGDVLDPGPDWSWPFCRAADGYLDEQRVPVGTTTQRGPDGRSVLVDLEPTVRDRDGNLRRITELVPRRP